MTRFYSLPVRLGLLVGGTMLPLILFSGFLVFSHYQHSRQEAFARVQQVTRGIKLVLDREVQGIVGGLTVLANTRSLALGDLEAFRLNAQAFVRQFPGSPSVVIADETGQQIFHSRIPAGQPLPIRADRPERREVFATGKPVFSRLFIGPVSHRPMVTITVPVFRDGKVVYDLSFDPPLEIFQRIIEQQRPNQDWTLSMFDQSGTNFARVPNPAVTIGQRASPTLFEIMFSAPEGNSRTVSLEGVPLLTAFSKSELTGWIAAAGIAENTLTAPAVQTFVMAAAIGMLMLLIGLGFAIRMATQIARGEALHALLVNELNHRVKNTLATVQSMASQTFRNSSDREAKQKFNSRLVALGSAHNLLSESKWEGADLRDTIEAVLVPFRSGQRLTVSGPELNIDARTVTILSMIIQELATNASKYGALAHADGRVMIEWERVEHSDPHVVLRWVERDGPPVKEPLQTGFGSTLIREGFAAQLGGSATLAFEPDGLACVLEFPLRGR
jgi:two-component sensor histidine kinase